MSEWVGGLAEWDEGDTTYLSIAFTWLLDRAANRAMIARALGKRVIAGGPALFLKSMRHELEDFAEIAKEHPDALARHNPDATIASRGCPGKGTEENPDPCKHCIVPKMWGTSFTLLPDFPVRPILCDDNLSALPADYQDGMYPLTASKLLASWLHIGRFAMAKPRFTFKQFQARFPDDDACLLEIFKRRYGTEIESCPSCGVVGKLTKIEGRRAFACKEGCHVYPCAGTVFEKSPTNLTKWFHAMYLFTTTRNGVSAKRIEREIGVTYKCAWRIGHQLRLLLAARDAADNPGPLANHAELDEVYIGGRIRKFTQHGKGEYLKNKSTIFGMIERGGVLRAQVVPNEKRGTLMPIVMANIKPGTKISTDRSHSYLPLRKLGYKHGRVNHAIGEYVRGDIHTNTIEGFWSHLKRGIKSTHAAVSKKHVQKYVDEFVFRYNNRHAPADMFNRVLMQITRAGS